MYGINFMNFQFVLELPLCVNKEKSCLSRVI